LNPDEIYSYSLEFAKEISKKSPESLAAIKKLLISNIFEKLEFCLDLEAKEFSSVLQLSGRQKIDEFFKSKKSAKNNG
jgi:enoyl-CoA hydratase/carnithine racemase